MSSVCSYETITVPPLSSVSSYETDTVPPIESDVVYPPIKVFNDNASSIIVPNDLVCIWYNIVKIVNSGLSTH